MDRRMLSVRNLVAGYGKVEVLHGLSFDVPIGQVTSLIGSNGAGKTTTLRALSGMIPTGSGSISFEGRGTVGLVSHQTAKLGIAHSPEGRRVFGSLSVSDNLMLGAFIRRSSDSRATIEKDRDRMFALFPRLGERRKQPAGTLSGGEQQMLAMARALMMRPKVLLLDEPSMGLAPRLVEEVFRTIARLKAERVTLLLVEQFAAAALEVADSAYVLENGRIVRHGSAVELKGDPAVAAAYLGRGGHA